MSTVILSVYRNGVSGTPMTKLAIVGTSSDQLLSYEIMEIQEKIQDNLSSRIDINEIISGGATGVDSIAEDVARMSFDGFFQCIPPKSMTKEHYLERNREIAQECDELWCFTTKRIITEKCYHHKPLADHQKTAGCYTLNEAKKLGKPVRLFVI